MALTIAMGTEPCYITDLAPELRLTIYECLLANCAQESSGTSAKVKYFGLINLAYTCKFFLHEAFDFKNKSRTYTFAVDKGITMLRALKPINLGEDLLASVPRMDGVRKLSLLINIELGKICRLRDHLLHFVSLLSRARLQRLHIHFSHQCATYHYAEERLMGRCRFTIAHLAAFLIDPIKNLRAFKGNSSADFLLYLYTENRQAW
jgi:hypothetical protein